MDVGQRIANILENKNWSQKDLAEKTKISKSVINRIVLGTRPARDDELITLSAALGVTASYLLGEAPTVIEQDELDLQQMLESNIAMTYGGEELTESERQRVKDILTTVFWEKTHKERDEDVK